MHFQEFQRQLFLIQFLIASERTHKKNKNWRSYQRLFDYQWNPPKERSKIF